MARSDYVARTKEILYGSGLGEKPSIRQVAANAAETISGSTISFSLATGEGQYVRRGHVLSSVSENDASTSYAMYVLDVSTDTVTATLQYLGSPASTTDSLDGVLLEQNALVPEYRIHTAIDTVFQSFLWPYNFKYAQYSIAPNLTTNQVELNANIREIVSATQVISNVATDIGFSIMRNLHTSVSSTGSLGEFSFVNGTTAYLTTKDKLVLGDESSDNSIVDLVAFGAAALCLDSSAPAVDMEREHKDATQRELVSDGLWRTFAQVRASRQEELARDNDYFYVRRG
jgi:hypothetical protein